MKNIEIVIFYFIAYSFLGWIIEGLFNLATQGYFLKPNFLIIPIKPMYGFAALFLLFVEPLVPLWLFCILSFFIPTIVEYASGFLLDYFLGLKYWTYSHLPLNLNGYVCLLFSFFWIVLALLLIYFVHPAMKLLYETIRPIWYVLCPLISLYLISDFVITVCKHVYRT